MTLSLISTEAQIIEYFGVQDLSWKDAFIVLFQDKSWTPKYHKICG